MTFSQLLFVLRARRKLILSVMLLAVAATLIVSLVMTKTYKATTTVVLNYKGIDPVTGFALPVQLMPGYVATQVDIIDSKSVALQVVDSLRLAADPVFRKKFASDTDGNGTIQDWLAERLLKKLDVTPSRESSVVEISFKGDTPQFAAAVANAFAGAYQQTSLRLKVDPVKKASRYFNEQIKTLRNNFETAQHKLSMYQKEKGIFNTDARLDVETTRLNELSSQLVTVQGQLMEASSRRRQARNGAAESPDVTADPLIQNLRAALAQAEAHLAEVGQRFMPEHPRYREARADVDKRRAALKRQVQSTSNSIANNAGILQQREAELAGALAAQKAKVLDLNRARDEMAVLAKEVESAQRAYDSATERFSQTSLEGQSHQSEVAVLNPALPPFRQASPRLWLNLLAALLGGALLGAGLALLAEMRNRRVRSASDLTELLHLPVLGAFDWRTPAPRPVGLSRWLLPRPAAPQ